MPGSGRSRCKQRGIVVTVTTVRSSQTTSVARPPDRITAVTERLAGWLAAHSVTVLRVSLGLVFLGFGVLKFFPGASPAEALVIRTVDTLTSASSRAPPRWSSPRSWRRSSG